MNIDGSDWYQYISKVLLKYSHDKYKSLLIALIIFPNSA